MNWDDIFLEVNYENAMGVCCGIEDDIYAEHTGLITEDADSFIGTEDGEIID